MSIIRFRTRSGLLILSPWIFLISQCAYYNTFYNAQKYFESAEKTRQKQQKGRGPGLEVPQIRIPDYDKAIEKASKILELYPKSRYVDDALMIIGKSFYYKGEMRKAQRKFEELLSHFPKSSFAAEARLWHIRCLIHLQEYDRAERELREFLGDKRYRKFWKDAGLLLGDLFFKQGDFETAIQEYRQALRKIRNRTIQARAQFQIGECYFLLEDYERAAAAYLGVRKFKPNPETGFQAELNYGKSLRHLGRYEEALRVFKRLLGRTIEKEKLGEIYLQIAICLEEMGRVGEALKGYQDVISDYSRTLAAAEASYRLGMALLHRKGDFRQAKKNFDQVRSQNARSPYVEEARRISKSITEVIKLRQTIAKNQTLLKKAKSDTSQKEARQEEKPKRPAQKPKRARVPTSGKKSTPLSGKIDKEAIQKKLIEDKFQLAEIYFFQFEMPDSALKQYKEMIQQFPDNPLLPKILYSMAYIYGRVKGDSTARDSLLQILAARYPQTPYGVIACKGLGLSPQMTPEDSARVLFREAERLFWDEGDIQRGLQLYRRVSESFPQTDWAAKSLYVIGWIYENRLNETKKAFEVYKRLRENYAGSVYARKVEKKVVAVQQAQVSDQKSTGSPSVPVIKDSQQAKPTGKKKSEEGTGLRNLFQPGELKQTSPSKKKPSMKKPSP